MAAQSRSEFDKWVARKSLANCDLRALHVPGRQKCVGRAACRRHGASRSIGHICSRAIPPAHSAHIPDVVRERRKCEMQPILRGHVTAQPLSPQDVLADERHERGMLGGVIQRVARTNAFQYEPGSLGDQSRIVGLATTEGALVGGRQSIAEGVGEHFTRIEHGRSRFLNGEPDFASRQQPYQRLRNFPQSVPFHGVGRREKR